MVRVLDWQNHQGIERVLTCQQQGNDKLHFDLVKLMTDGSTQGFSARLLWSGYHNGHDSALDLQIPVAMHSDATVLAHLSRVYSSCSNGYKSCLW